MNNLGVQITTVTNRDKVYLKNIAKNFVRQVYEPKYLYLIINSNKIDVSEAQNILIKNGVDIRKTSIKKIENTPLGLCLNDSIDNMFHNCSLWAKFDDDDFYGSNYLVEKIRDLKRHNAGISGQVHMICYVPEMNRYYLRTDGPINGYTSWVRGASLVCNKSIFLKIRFGNKYWGSDTQFLKDAFKAGIKIYAGTPNHFVNIRHIDTKYHTWKENFVDFLRKTRQLNHFRIFKMFPQFLELKEHIFFKDK